MVMVASWGAPSGIPERSAGLHLASSDRSPSAAWCSAAAPRESGAVQDLPLGLLARLGATSAPVFLFDHGGWVVRANVNACRLLDPPGRRTIATFVGRQAPGLHAAPAAVPFHRIGYFNTSFLDPDWIHARDVLASLSAVHGPYAAARARVLPPSVRAPAHSRAATSLAAPPATTKVRHQLADELGSAIDRHEIKLEYQPQFVLETGAGCGVEALARWSLPTGRVISPAAFISLAERTGLIQALGAGVLHSACETALAWTGQSLQRTTLSVNVSARQITPDFCRVIDRVLADTGFPPQRLELEITESSLVRNTQRMIELLKEWKRSGVQIAVDDFGTGYSSLSYLSRLPVDRLKMDRSLIHQMALEARSAIVARSIVDLGAEIGIEVIAEGVETERQLHMLQEMGCPRVQGYLFGRPMPAEDVQSALRTPWGHRPLAATLPPRPDTGSHHVC